MGQSYPEATYPHHQKKKKISRYYNKVQTMLRDQPDVLFSLDDGDQNESDFERLINMEINS